MLFKQPLLRKVPEITIYFWLVKLLTTAMGEATSDYFVNKYNPYLSVFAGGLALAVALFLQFKFRRYNAWIYWFTVTMVAVFGTMAADGLHKQLGVPYVASTIFFAVVLAIVFKVWHSSEGTLSIHSISSRRREVFYWLTILSTFALGTAAGDLTANTIGLGYFTSGIMFAGIFLIPATIYWLTKSGEVLWFWIAYVLTRPLGASFADWFGKSKAVGGLAYGDGKVSIILSIVIVMFVAYLAITKRDIKTMAHRLHNP